MGCADLYSSGFYRLKLQNIFHEILEKFVNSVSEKFILSLQSPKSTPSKMFNHRAISHSICASKALPF